MCGSGVWWWAGVIYAIIVLVWAAYSTDTFKMVAVVSVAFVRPVSHCLGKSKYLCFFFFPFNQVFDRFDRRGGGSVDYLRFLELIGFSATHTSSSATRTRGGY